MRDATGRLPGRVDEVYTDVQALMGDALKHDRAWLIAHADDECPEQQKHIFQDYVERRRRGHPVAHITGVREFWSLVLHVTADTLIPRPDTEILVEQVLASGLPDDARVLDFGTGSGAIALALAKEQPGWCIEALDTSAAALAVAQRNAKDHHISNVRFSRGDTLTGYRDRSFHAIVSNPPYIAANDAHLSQGDVRFEPATALVSGEDGLDCIRYLVAHAAGHLVSGGMLLLEHGYDQAGHVRELFADAAFVDIGTSTDLAGHERVTQGRVYID